MIRQLLWHDLCILWRDGQKLLHPLVVVMGTMLLLPLLFGKVATLTFPHLWVVAMFFATLLTMPLLYEHDSQDGAMALYHMLKLPLWKRFLAKLALHSIIAFLPLLLCGAAWFAMLPMWYSILVVSVGGMLLLSLVGTLVATLVLGISRSQGLMTILVLPLIMPILLGLLTQLLHPLPLYSYLLPIGTTLVALVLGCTLGGRLLRGIA